MESNIVHVIEEVDSRPEIPDLTELMVETGTS